MGHRRGHPVPNARSLIGATQSDPTPNEQPRLSLKVFLSKGKPHHKVTKDTKQATKEEDSPFLCGLLGVLRDFVV
jgi:hypothetical protein